MGALQWIVSQDVVQAAVAHRPWDGAASGFLRDRIFSALQRRHRSRVWVDGPHAADDAIGLILAWYASDSLDDDVELWMLVTSRDPEVRARARSGRLDDQQVERLGNAERNSLHRVGPGISELVRPLRRILHVGEVDLEREPWPRQLDLIVLRHRVFATADADAHLRFAELAHRSLESHAWLVLGEGEVLPPGSEAWFTMPQPGLPVYRRLH